MVCCNIIIITTILVNLIDIRNNAVHSVIVVVYFL